MCAIAVAVSAAAGGPALAGDETSPDGREPAPCGAPPDGMACVPGGWFWRGTDDGPPDTRPRERVWVDTFYMDKTEVTTEAFEACQKAKKCGYGKPFYPDFSRPKQPMVAVTWYRAVEFCQAHGKHLPTEAEWEKAARGPDGRLHPWGDEEATCERAIIMDATGRSCGVKMESKWPDKGRTFEVASRPAQLYGLFDMSGNAWEWVADWYSPSYAACGDKCRGADPRGPCDGKEPCRGHDQRLVRGGSWYWPAKYATAVWRRPHYPKNRPFHHFGWRCAMSLEEAKVR
ncbi:MAG: SUMF1/EgtB/PvdO family nonheme iron enzyme [Deltaproteobacteria bacterium]|nr:SUMF1/EgtB/PvdO family nonheme iron enzyme [Deltaproteobacteria bacterium]